MEESLMKSLHYLTVLRLFFMVRLWVCWIGMMQRLRRLVWWLLGSKSP